MGRQWGLKNIRAVDRKRAAWLGCAGSSEDLIDELQSALARALPDPNAHRLAVDSRFNKFEALRTIIQFQVTPDLYDWFFNGRTGYRAQFLTSAEHGLAFNGKLVRALAQIIRSNSGPTMQARKIEVDVQCHRDGSADRNDTDVGAMNVSGDTLLGSLEPSASKVWICERRSKGQCGAVERLDLVVLRKAALELPQLDVDGWSEDGHRAPLPIPEYCWLDLKGTFVGDCGAAQIKDEWKRAEKIHSDGWT